MASDWIDTSSHFQRGLGCALASSMITSQSTNSSNVSNFYSLAYAELYMVIARLARQFDFELYDTTEENLAFARDFQAIFPEDGNICMKVKVSGMIDE